MAEKKRILLVDDEESITRLLALHLEATGLYEVRTENQGAMALTTAQRFRPHLIFLDVVMPDVGGGVVAQQLQQDPRLKDVPVVFLTAILTKKEAEERGGIVAGRPFLAKPVSIDAVLECLKQHLD